MTPVADTHAWLLVIAAAAVALGLLVALVVLLVSGLRSAPDSTRH